jgi:hypothetical protein
LLVLFGNASAICNSACIPFDIRNIVTCHLSENHHLSLYGAGLQPCPCGQPQFGFWIIQIPTSKPNNKIQLKTTWNIESISFTEYYQDIVIIISRFGKGKTVIIYQSHASIPCTSKAIEHEECFWVQALQLWALYNYISYHIISYHIMRSCPWSSHLTIQFRALWGTCHVLVLLCAKMHSFLHCMLPFYDFYPSNSWL